MTTRKLFKRRVRERMTKTGERYTAARRQLAARRDNLPESSLPESSLPDPRLEPALPESARQDLSGAFEIASDERMTAATGRSWEAWLGLLDRWGGRERKRGETVAFLMADHGVAGWWAQAIASGLERTRGIRAKHQQATGFTIYASKTVDVPLEDLFAAFVDERVRRLWLIDGSMALRTSQAGRTARFDWEDGTTRVLVTFEAKAPRKATAHVAHERLAGPAEAEAAKAAWRDRLARLAAILTPALGPT